MNFQRTVNSVLTLCLSPGDNPTSLLFSVTGYFVPSRRERVDAARHERSLS